MDKIKFIFFLFFLATLAGCQIPFTDPYSGQYDPNRSLRSEGLVSGIYHVLGVGKPQGMVPADTIHRQLMAQVPCSDSWRAKRLLKKVHEDLTQSFSAQSAILDQQGRLLTVTLSGLDAYDSGHEHIRPVQYDRLRQLINHLQSYGTLRVTVVGHADAIDTEEYNQTLAARRAEHIARYVIENEVPQETVSVKAYGENEPVVSNATPAGRALNRRVTLEICSV